MNLFISEQMQASQPLNNLNPNKLFFYVVLLSALYFGYVLLRPYVGVIIFSLVTVVVFRPVYLRYVQLLKGHEGAAVTATLATLFITVLVPLWIIGNIIISQVLEFGGGLTPLVEEPSVSVANVVTQVNELLRDIPFAQGYQISEAQVTAAVQRVVQPVASFTTSSIITLGTFSLEWLTNSIVFLVLVSSLFPAYPRLLQLFRDVSPLDDELDHKYVHRLTAMTRSMVKGVFVIALAQGIAAGVFYWLAGVPYTFFWTILSTLMAFLPLGVGVVGVPIGLVLLLTGNIWQGLLVLGGILLVVTNIDNVLRPRLVSSEACMHPALVILSALGGLSLFGFLGAIYGPVIMIFVLTTIEVYLEQYRLHGKHTPAVVELPAPATPAITPELAVATPERVEAPTRQPSSVMRDA